MRTTSYVVYLCGRSNSANKPMDNGPVPVGVFDGSGKTARDRRSDACDRAAKAGATTVYNGQYLDAKPASRVSVDEYNAAAEAGDLPPSPY